MLFRSDGHFGEHARESSIAMLDAGLVHLVASDGHDLEKRLPVLAGAYKFVAYRWGEPLARKLFFDHPRAVIDGAAIAIEPPRARRKKKWWAFWRPLGRLNA